MDLPLSNNAFRHLFVAQVIALVGTGLTTVALALLAYDLAGGDAGQVLGIALALKMVAYVGIAPVIGGYAHRLPRRRLLIGLDLARAATVVLLPFVSEIWQIYTLIFVLNACSAGFTPVFQATIPDVLPEERDYTRALSLSRLAYDLENLLSPTLAVALLVVMSFHNLFLLNTAAFLCSAVLVLTVRLPAARKPEYQTRLLHNVSWGIRIYLATPRLRGLLLLSLAVAAAGAMVIINTVVYIRDLLGGSEADVAVALAASGAGSMLVALLLPKVLDRSPDRPAMLIGGCLMFGGLMLGALKPAFIWLLPVWFVLGAGSSLVLTPTGRLLRRSCHAEDRPAVYAAQFSLSHACWLVTYPLAGWLGSAAGLSITFLVLAAIVIAATGMAALVWRAESAEELTHTHKSAEHEHVHSHDEHHQHEHESWEGPEPHRHSHQHGGLTHRHRFVIDYHHRQWP